MTPLRFLRDAARAVLREYGWLLPNRGAFHEYALSRASYAPWTIDDEFIGTFASVRKHTLVDIYRCFELWQLVEQTRKLSGALIEVGAWQGGTGGLIAKRAALCAIREPVYLCDTFTGVVKAGTNDGIYKGGEYADTSKELVESFIGRELQLNNVTILEGVFPEESGYLIADQQFRFCHIDVDVYESARAITEWIWPKVSVGGIVVYDDYGFRACNGITELVEEERAKDDRIVIHNLNGHAIVIKVS